MRVYFLSSMPAALYVGGAYFGQVSDFERFAEISLQDHLPVRLDAAGMLPMHFFLHEQIPLSPPDGIDVYRFDGGIALYAHGYTHADSTLSVIAQEKRENVLATVCKQGGIFLCINTPEGFVNAPLPPSFWACELFFIGEHILIKNPTQVCVFHKNGRLLLQENYLRVEWTDSELQLILPLSDQYKRTAECTYSIFGDRVERTAYRLKQDDSIPTDGLLAYAFFESVRIGADFTQFLCKELQEHPENITDFLGNFLSVLPTANPTVCLLVYKKAERLFDVRKFSVVFDDGKITDING